MRWVGLLAALALPAVVKADALGVKAAKTRIVRIDIRCEEPIDERGVRGLLPFEVGDEYKEADLEEARRLLSLSEIFESIRIDAEPSVGGVAIHVRLRRVPLVNRIRFEGNRALGREELRRLTRLRAGFPLTEDARKHATDRIRERYENEGFPDAVVDSRLQLIAPGEVNVVFTIDEGMPSVVGAIEIRNAPPHLLADLRKALGAEEGGRYVRARLNETEKKMVAAMRDHGYYEARVTGRWEAEDTHHRGRLLLEVRAGPRFVLDVRGNQKLALDDLLEPMNLRDRPIITDGTWRQLARRATRTYQERGFHQAEVKLVAVDLTGEGASAVKTVRYEIVEGRRFRIRSVEIAGNREVPDDSLRAVMQTRPPSWIPWHKGVLVDELLDQDLERLRALYHGLGFLAARIRSRRIEHDTAAGLLTVHVELDEGPRTIVESVAVDDQGVLGGKLPVLRTIAEMPFSDEAIEEDRRSLLAAVVARGYSDAEVGADVQMTDGKAAVTFTVKPRRQLRIGRVIVQGNFDARTEVIARELPFRSGDVLDPERLLEGQGRVYKLGLFRSVSVRAVAGSDAETRDVIVRVAEKPPGAFQWGLGYNTRDGFRGVGQVGYHNLQGLGRSIALRGQLDVDVDEGRPNQYLSDLSYREPRLLDTLSSGSLKLLAQRTQRDIDKFKLQRVAFISGIERPLGGAIIAGLSWQIDRTEVFDLAPEIAAEGTQGCPACPRIFDDESAFLSLSLDPFVVRNALDDEFRPRSGTFESLRLRLAPGSFATDVPLVKLVGQHSHYIPFGDYFTFIYALRFGWGRALEKNVQVPIQERFFLGGRATVRGFSENSLGPEARGDVTSGPGDSRQRRTPPLGGDVSVNVNSELHFPILYGLRGAVFFDGGGVYLQTYDARGESFREAAGAGLRYMTPVGPLSLDYGFKLDRRGSESLGQIHFSVGRVF